MCFRLMMMNTLMMQVIIRQTYSSNKRYMLGLRGMYDMRILFVFGFLTHQWQSVPACIQSYTHVLV